MADGLQLIAVTHRAGQIAEALFEQALGRKDITARQAQVLAAIADADGANQTHVVLATEIDRSTLGDICKRLARKGLITRRRTKHDARAYTLKLTPEGVALLRRIETAAVKAAQAAREQIKGIDQLRIKAPVQDAAE